jgi:hypothetical protein
MPKKNLFDLFLTVVLACLPPPLREESLGNANGVTAVGVFTVVRDLKTSGSQVRDSLEPHAGSNTLLPLRFAGRSMGSEGSAWRSLFASCGRLERNTVYRGSCSGAQERTRIHRGFERTTRNEQYILVPNGNIEGFAA